MKIVSVLCGTFIIAEIAAGIVRRFDQRRFHARVDDYPFNNVTLSWRERVNDLVSRLTIEEIAQQMANGGSQSHAPGIPRLGIQPYSWASECLRGDVGAGPATSFPQALGLAASFSPEVIFSMAEATGIEVRAKYNNYSRHGDYGRHTGASCFSPVINIMRDPRWGRNQETYGEDPFLSGVMAAAFVRGLQGSDERFIRANAGCKHFDVYAGPENIPINRLQFDAKVSERDWRMTFLPAFRMCVEAGTYSLMCSYNSINGIPACANKRLLTDILRNEWGFNGYVVSDGGAIEDIMTKHNYTTSIVDTAAAAVNAGTNAESGPGGSKAYFASIPQAIKQGKLTESVVREAVKPSLYTRMRLGLFDPPEFNPYASLDPAVVVQSPEHRLLSLILAMRSFVLLKNNKFLPLPKGKKFQKLAIVGPMADNVRGQFGDYSPDPDRRFITTPIAGLQNLAFEMTYSGGCIGSNTHCTNYRNTDISNAVNGADFIIVCLGTGVYMESEANDRSNIDLPGKQLQLLQDSVAYSANTTPPVLLILMNAGPLDISWAKNNDRIVAIIEAFFPAQAAGEALRRVIYNEGDFANPAGRLPSTWPMNVNQYPPITDYTMVNRTYRYFEGEPMYPFGYGLSYSTFTYRTLDVRPAIVHYGDVINIDVYVSNNGPFDGEEVVQVYVSWSNTSLPTPKLQLVAFNRYFIPRGRGMTVHFQVTLEQLAVWNDDPPGFVTLQGSYTVYAGGQQPNQKTAVPSNVLTGKFSVA